MKTLEEKIISTKSIQRTTWISFVLFGVFITGCIGSWLWLKSQPLEEGALAPLRKMFTFNEFIFGNLQGAQKTATEYSSNDAVTKVRVNGDAGLGDNFDTSTWKLQIIKSNLDTLYLGINEIKSLPSTEIIFDFKCIEGWNQVTRWRGVRFSDFIQKYGLLKESELYYTGLATPDKEYYVGIDRKSMLNPQTILCYEMNGAPLPMNQGAPLRLIIPVKYGIKHLKRIGTIFFSNEKPKDYWFERGYDYYSGL